MTISSAAELATAIEQLALLATLKDGIKINELVTLETTIEGEPLGVELTMYAPGKFFGIARYNNLVGRVRVDGESASIMSIECNRRAQ